VALTTDEEIVLKKGYQPQLGFSSRKEVLEAIRFVDEVVPSPRVIGEAFLDLHRIDMLLHGDDNSNPIPSHRTIIIPRTSGISSLLIRKRTREIGD
jgi:glycerol-3-phosphate cytidylyltransferase